MRGLFTSGLALTLALAAGCARTETAESDRVACAEAEALEAKGDLPGASERWRQVVVATTDRRIQARAELARARIETLTDARDRALKRLDALGASGTVTPDQLTAIANEIVQPFHGTPVESVILARRDELLAASTRTEGVAEGKDADLARELIARQEFAAALHFLREVEDRRGTAGRAEVTTLLDEVAAAADRSATQLLEQASHASSREDSLKSLETAAARYRGTPAYPRIVVAIDRVRADGKSDRHAASAPVAEPHDH